MKRFAEADAYMDPVSPPTGGIIDADGDEGKLQPGKHKFYHADLAGSHFVAVIGTFREDDYPLPLFKQFNRGLQKAPAFKGAPPV